MSSIHRERESTGLFYASRRAGNRDGIAAGRRARGSAATTIATTPATAATNECEREEQERRQRIVPAFIVRAISDPHECEGHHKQTAKHQRCPHVLESARSPQLCGGGRGCGYGDGERSRSAGGDLHGSRDGALGRVGGRGADGASQIDRPAESIY